LDTHEDFRDIWRNRRLFWDGLQGGMIEVATFKMPAIVFWDDSGYHAFEGILTALILSFFYKKYVMKTPA